MNLIEKLEDLLKQAVTEKTHFYTASVLKETITYIKKIEQNKVSNLTEYETKIAISAIEVECKAILRAFKKNQHDAITTKDKEIGR